MTGFGSFLFGIFVVAVAVTTMMVVPPAGTEKGGGWRSLEGLIRSFIGLNQDRPGLDNQNGTTWAVLVAGSNQYVNYRHQADVCHAYQILKRGGLKDENIVVFMYDDIAGNKLNPRPGTIINNPDAVDVYAGVLKDYTRKHLNVDNLFAVLLGNKTAVKGGSGKVLDTKPKDRIFFFYSDHGGPGILGMPNGQRDIVANDFINVLKKKHAMGTYKEMVIYVESCESGSIFEGLLPDDLNIYVTTASKADEGSWATYCPDTDTPPPPEYTTCLGDLYSVSWMEDSETNNRKKESLRDQFEKVRNRTSDNGTYRMGSHVMQYGTKHIETEKLYLYQGFDPSTMNVSTKGFDIDNKMGDVNQWDADVISMWHTYNKAMGSEKAEILEELNNTLRYRAHLDTSVEAIGTFLFGPEKGQSVLGMVRDQGQPLVDDWECFKSTIQVFEKHCGRLTTYNMKQTRAFANVCNNAVESARFEEACVATCNGNDIVGLYATPGSYSV